MVTLLIIVLDKFLMSVHAVHVTRESCELHTSSCQWKPVKYAHKRNPVKYQQI
jgi:hypothetical protein